MAQVDFDNATITHIADSWGQQAGWLDLTIRTAIYDDRRIPLATNAGNQLIQDNLTHFAFRHYGTFIESGVNKTLYITNNYGSANADIFAISPITFNAGDTYDFTIDVNMTVE